jgi:hypothetical protein
MLLPKTSQLFFFFAIDQKLEKEVPVPVLFSTSKVNWKNKYQYCTPFQKTTKADILRQKSVTGIGTYGDFTLIVYKCNNKQSLGRILFLLDQ